MYIYIYMNCTYYIIYYSIALVIVYNIIGNNNIIQ